jgi:hypothetical protein
MVHAQLFAKGLDWTARVEEALAEVGNLRAKAEAELKEISEKWPADKPIDRLKVIAYIFATTGRWDAQLKERFGALAG